jgi:two-component system cell cycle response regulator
MSMTENREQTTVLLIDDDASVHDLIDFHLEGVVDRILHAHHPSAGLTKAAQERPDVILLDVNMPHLDGFQVCRQLKESDQTRDIPVLFLTVDDSVHYIARALDIGGSDYVVKPFQTVELQARVRAALRTRRLIEMLRKHARMDALTGLKNRGALEESLELAAAGFGRHGKSYAVIILDIDHFKRVNDTHGHGIGDETLRKLGYTLANLCRPTDVAARYGGEEFVVILHDVGEREAEATCARLLAAFREIKVAIPDGHFGFTCSAGLAMVEEGLDADHVVERADEALYQAKNQGRDRMILWSSLQGAPLNS